MIYLFLMCVSGIIMEIYHIIAHPKIQDINFRYREISRFTNLLNRANFITIMLHDVGMESLDAENPFLREAATKMMPDIKKVRDDYKELFTAQSVMQYAELAFTKTERYLHRISLIVEPCYCVCIIGIVRELAIHGYVPMAWIVGILIAGLSFISAYNNYGREPKWALWDKIDCVICIAVYLNILVNVAI